MPTSFFFLSLTSHQGSPVALGLKYSLTGAGPSWEIVQGSQWRREGRDVDAIGARKRSACRRKKWFRSKKNMFLHFTLAFALFLNSSHPSSALRCLAFSLARGLNV